MSCICLPLSSSFVCLAEITTRRWCSPRLYCVRLLSAHHVHPSRLLPPSLSLSLSLLHDWSFCHYFLAAGGDLGNLVNLLTTNCLLLPCCLDKQPGWGGSEAPVTYKSRCWKRRQPLPLHGSLRSWLSTCLLGLLNFGFLFVAGSKTSDSSFLFSLSHPVLS